MALAASTARSPVPKVTRANSSRRRIPLDRCCRHRILDRSGRGSLRDPAHAGAESASAAARHGENHGLRCANRWKKLAGLRGLSDQSNSPHPSRRASRPQGEGVVGFETVISFSSSITSPRSCPVAERALPPSHPLAASGFPRPGRFRCRSGAGAGNPHG